MERTYKQFSLTDRCEIARLRAAGFSIRKIAATLDRAPSTIAREISRNSRQQGRYSPEYAQQQSRARRWTGSILDRDPLLRKLVFSALSVGWSPEQVSERLAYDFGVRVISYETIYRFAYAQITRTKDYSWSHCLPRGKSKRGRRGRKGGSSASFIAHRRPISERPDEVNDRLTIGDWEADLMQFTVRHQIILTLHERYSRLLIAIRLPNKTAEVVIEAIKRILGPLPALFRQTVTFDNGTEFAHHYELNALGIQTFFCDTYSPWQKGGIENAIGRMRRTLPRKTDLAALSANRFNYLIQAYNNTPRKCLDFQTPAELFWNQVLHFKCESALPPSRE